MLSGSKCGAIWTTETPTRRETFHSVSMLTHICAFWWSTGDISEDITLSTKIEALR